MGEAMKDENSAGLNLYICAFPIFHLLSATEYLPNLSPSQTISFQKPSTGYFVLRTHLTDLLSQLHKCRVGSNGTTPPSLQKCHIS